MRDMSEWETEYEAKGVVFLAVNAFEDPDDGRAFIESSELRYNWMFAGEKALDELGIGRVPAQILIGKDGKVRWTSSMTTISSGAAGIRRAIDAVLGES